MQQPGSSLRVHGRPERVTLGWKDHQAQGRACVGPMEADFEQSTAKFWINKFREEGDPETK